MSHGLRVTYTYRGCRCTPCTEANRDYKRAQRLIAGKPFVAKPKETTPAKDCGICFSPIAEHRPYFAHVRTA